MDYQKDKGAEYMMNTDLFTGYRKRQRHYRRMSLVLLVILLGLIWINMTIGTKNYTPAEVIRILFSTTKVEGSYVIKSLRLPRTLAAVLCGFAFGVAGNTFQTMLGNPLASPDIIGVTSGSSVAAVFGILILGANRGVCSLMGLFSGLLAAALIFAIAYNGYYSNAKLILTGIGAQALFSALVSWMLLIASEYDVTTAMRWLSGNLNGMTMNYIPYLAVAVVIATGTLLIFSGAIKALELGDAYAQILGIRVNLSRIILIICSVCLIAFATAVSGPIASIAFLSGPIATKICKKGHSNTIPAGLIGAILTIGADFIGNVVLPTRYPVGVITGILGAPYLLYLLINMNKGEKI